MTEKQIEYVKVLLLVLTFVVLVGILILMGSMSSKPISEVQITTQIKEATLQIEEPLVNQRDLNFEIVQDLNGFLSKADVYELVDSVNFYSELNEIPSIVVYGMMWQESSFRPKAKSHLGSEYGKGLLQVSDVALADYIRKHPTCTYVPSDLYDIAINIEVGTWVFQQNTHYGVDDIEDALIIAYNCGAGTYKKEKDFLLSGRRKSGEPYRHLLNVNAYILELRSLGIN